VNDFLLARLKARMKHGEPIASLTAYDYFTALLARDADLDFVLVGDSLGNVVQGHSTTIPVTLDEIIYHTRIVARHFPSERVVLDMPFGSFKLEARETVANAVRAFKESGCGAVKFEGAGTENLLAVEQLSAAGVPVMAHLGLLPQRVHAEGGYRMQGRGEAQAQRLLADARALERSGALALVLECVEPELARQISAELAIPTIGIGSGSGCDGQILVVHDLLGLLPGRAPGFVKRYAELYGQAVAAAARYRDDVRGRRFPEDSAIEAGREKPRRLANVYSGDGDA
jgi:3-methyl-2-oxobutanoate hydroxymethyltransferase